MVLDNLRFLAIGRRSAWIDPQAITRARSLGRSGQRLAEVLHRVDRASGGVGRAAVMSLLWHQEWTTDLTRPLSGASVISCVREAA